MSFITKKVNKNEWDLFVESTLYNTIFSLSIFLDSLEVKYNSWITYYKNKPIIGTTVQFWVHLFYF